MRMIVSAACLLSAAALHAQDYVGTTEPFASEAVYFVVTDRFVDGDPDNNFEDQGGKFPSFGQPWEQDGEVIAHLGYQGGDFRGILNNADYIADMGFTALWITPIVENPDQHFSGSHRPGEGMFSDRGKSGYHGYWATNFFEVDEHWESDDLAFADLTRALREEHGIKLVLDIVGNHGSPAWSMREEQPGYGKIYSEDGRLLADHQNLHPTELSDDNPLHAWYNHEPDLATLGDFDADNPEVMDYLVNAYLKWIGQGAAAFRIDTIRHQPHSFWKEFSDRIRAEHQGFFMFGEAFNYEAAEIATHTRPENGGVSVLDFPGRDAMERVFSKGEPMTELLDYLHLTDGVYDNPYDLMTFYDNHDMPRMGGDVEGFIDAHNWLFTSRGIPVIYYGSESFFRPGAAEHAGNRDFFGQANVDAAKSHPIRQALKRIAHVRKDSVALQRGVQINREFTEDTASFLRVYQTQEVSQTAMVLLNRSDAPVDVSVGEGVHTESWRDAISGDAVRLVANTPVTVPPHGVRVFLSDKRHSE